MHMELKTDSTHKFKKKLNYTKFKYQKTGNGFSYTRNLRESLTALL